jgi:hypothetical protein
MTISTAVLPNSNIIYDWCPVAWTRYAQLGRRICDRLQCYTRYRNMHREVRIDYCPAFLHELRNPVRMDTQQLRRCHTCICDVTFIQSSQPVSSRATHSRHY